MRRCLFVCAAVVLAVSFAANAHADYVVSKTYTGEIGKSIGWAVYTNNRDGNADLWVSFYEWQSGDDVPQPVPELEFQDWGIATSSSGVTEKFGSGLFDRNVLFTVTVDPDASWDYFRFWGEGFVSELKINGESLSPYDPFQFSNSHQSDNGQTAWTYWYGTNDGEPFVLTFTGGPMLDYANGLMPTAGFGIEFFKLPDVGGAETTPEPATLLILGFGAVGAGFATRRRMRK